jgi:hypothetical protein
MANNNLTSVVTSQLQWTSAKIRLPKCSIPVGPSLNKLNLANNKIKFEFHLDPVTNQMALTADDGEFYCYGAFTFGYKWVYGIFIASPLRELDLSYNLLEDAEASITFVFNPFTATKCVLYQPQPSP